jgi:hypothetical protein
MAFGDRKPERRPYRVPSPIPDPYIQDVSGWALPRLKNRRTKLQEEIVEADIALLARKAEIQERINALRQEREELAEREELLAFRLELQAVRARIQELEGG